MDKVPILSSLQVEQIIQRISHQILENNYDETEIVLVGIANRGFQVAKKIESALTSIAEAKITLLEINLDKDSPLENNIQLSNNVEYLEGKTIILIDDVLKSGKTLIYATRYLLQANVKSIATVVLVDRRHRLYPIRADYAGKTLSTTLQEHISVEFTDEGVSVFLQ